MADILLVPAPVLDRGRLVPCLPYGLLSLQAAARECGHQLDIFDTCAACEGHSFKDSDELAETIVAGIDCERYGVIGLPVTCGSMHHALCVSALLKDISPELKIWLGGPHASLAPSLLLERFPTVDAVFVGESEATLMELLSSSTDGYERIPDSVSGICTRESFTRRKPAQDLDQLPLIGQASDYEAFYAASQMDGGQGGLFLEVERGCNGKCSFCSTRQFWGDRGRYKSPSRVVQEMDGLCELTGECSFELVGDNLMSSPRRLWSLCDYLAQERPAYQWRGALALDLIQLQDLDRLWDGGCRGFFAGLESGSQATLDRVGKRLDIKQAAEIAFRAIDQGFLVETSFIVGFPWETRSDLEHTCRLHSKLLDRGAYHSQVQMLCPIAGTDLELAERSRLRPGRYSTLVSDGLPRGSQAAAIVQICPELFTHFCHVETENVSSAEVRASVFVAELLAVEASHRRHSGSVAEKS